MVDGRPRLFVAVELPEHVRAAIDRNVSPLRGRWATLRWAPPERWHVTLRFLGERPAEDVEQIVSVLDRVAARTSPFPTWITGLGCFPASRRATVLWAGLDDGEGLSKLAEAVQRALEGRFGQADRAFRPHITLARTRRPTSLDLGGAPAFEQIGFEVEGFALMRSRLEGRGPRYEPLRRLSFPR